MFEFKSSDSKIIYIEMNDDITVNAPDNAKYVICECSYNDFQSQNELKAAGFEFLDRLIRVQIDTNSSLINEKIVQIQNGSSGIIVSPGSDYSELMTQLYHKAYTEDRRFHLTKEFDQIQANDVIDGYIEYLKDTNATPITAVSDGNLIGCTILKPSPEGGIANLLGATLPGIKGRMAALPLYIGTLDYIRQGGTRMYYGEISSCNLASLNLHFALGAKVTAIKDKYILRV